MRFADPFAAPGKWYKGNLHTHTTESDGALDPAEVVRRYRDAQYDFLALTDHGRVTVAADPSEGAPLLLLGTEMDGDSSELGERYHILAFGLSEACQVPDRPKVAEAIAWAKQHGGEAVVAHPYWSGLALPDLLRCEGNSGIEIFNTGCHYELAKGYSTVHWDDLLGSGHRAWGFAVDDSHHGVREHRPTDTARAWIMVKASALTQDAIMESIRSGLFYSSWGPTIHEMAVTGAEVRAVTSPVKEINFIAQRWAGGSFTAPEGETLTSAVFPLRGHENYLRVECRDAEGRWAFSNPIFFGD